MEYAIAILGIVALWQWVVLHHLLGRVEAHTEVLHALAAVTLRQYDAAR